MSAIIAATLIGSLLPTLPLAAAAAAEPYTPPSAVSPEKPVKTSNAKTKGRPADTTVSKPDSKHGALPGKGKAAADVPGEKGKAVKAGNLPVSVTSSGTAAKAQVEVLGQDTAAKAGITGMLFTVTGVDEHTGVAVDYSSFTQAAGSGYGSRLKLVRLPDCALTTPQLAECRVQTSLPGGNDLEAQTVKADTLTAAPAGSTRIQGAGSPVVLGLSSGSAGPGGDYTATPLSSASTWSTSLNSGSFTWSYDMPLTAMPGGLTPKLGLSYNSGAIDGRTSNSNNQASWAGDGFDLAPGFVERSYKPCADDGAPKTGTVSPGDLCWGTDNATISFAGHSGELIPVSADEWRIKNDDNTKIVRVRDTARGNGDNDGEYFKATTTDGTIYYFGYNRLPNWSTGKPETKSVYTVPVFGNNAGEPCNASTFDASWCQQGWRWNLDLVVDAHGNDITYWYTPETNNYGRNLKATNRTPYIRGGRLDHIEYGQQKNDIYSGTVKPMARVEFGTTERCLESPTLCAAGSIDTNRLYWYDTPWDQNCKDGTDCASTYSPTFFTRTRLTQVVAKTLQADGSYAAIDTWDLTHKWGTADFDYQLLLDSIKHTGNSAAPAVPLPKTTLAYKQMVNRLDKTGDGRMPFVKQRLGTITDEIGGQIDVNYSGEACTWGSLPTPQTNTTRCFPQMYQASETSPVTTEWFNKYVVESVIGTDRTGGAPEMVTHYTYLGDAAWHFDDEDGLTKEKLKTWSQWRGYAHVRVETGGNAAMSTQADHWYLRGMDGDRNNPSDKNSKRTVTVNDGEGTTLTDDNAWAGVEYRTEQYDKPGGTILGKSVSTPWKAVTATRVRDWGTTTANLTGASSARSFTSLDKGAGSNWRETRINTTYDTYGRATAMESLGDVSVTGDEKCARSTYLNNTSAWILKFTSRIETVAATCGATVDRDTKADGTSTVLSDVRYRFDGQGYGTAPTKGDITLTETLKSRTGTSATYLDNSATYDAYGRVLSATDLASSTVYDTTGATSPVTTASSYARTTTTVFTPATGRPTKSVVTTPPATAGNSATAQTTTTDFDLMRGQAKDSVDTNNRRTEVQYDALGRTLKVWLQDRIGQGNPNQEYVYTVAENAPAAVATKTLNDEDGTQQTSYTIYDGFARARQTQVPGENGGRILTDTFYDERGQAALSYSPYYSKNAPSAVLSKADDLTNLETQTAVAYDGLGRTVKTTALSGNGVGTPLYSTLTEYNGDRVTVTPPAGGTPTTTITDAAGQTTELRQYKSATPTGAYDATSYGYDQAGHLSKLTDPAGTTWTWLYNQLGQQTKAVDPDSGTAVKTYNDRGEVTSTTDGRGNTIANVYDNHGRLTETHSGSATGPLLTSQAWDPANNKGLLASSTRYSTVSGTTYQYTTTYSLFDALARPTRTTVTIPSVPGQEGLAGTYISGTIYRVDGQARTTSYPAAGNLPSESLAFTYDALRRLTGVDTAGGYAYQTGQSYSLTGKPVQTKLNSTAGKEILVTNTYEWGTQRLATSRTDRYGIATPARAAAYTYDQAGNVTSVTDSSSSGTDQQCFQYDYLTRLTEAYTPNTGSCSAPDGTKLGGPAPYWTSWTYNTNGTRATETRHNTTGNTGQDSTTTYTYPAATAARPHSLTSTSTVTGAAGTPVAESYDYDNAGNTTGRHLKPAGNQTSDQTLTWDNESKLSKITDMVKTTVGSTTTTTSKTTDYLYDAGGNRLIGHTLDTANPAAENWTLYLGNTELKLVKGAAKATATRYYPLSSGTAIRTDDNKVTFQTTDHHGTAEVNIDATTGAMDQRHSLPFGATRGTNPTTWAGTRGFLGGTNEPTGLTHLGARDYDPTTGRFTSVDPLLNPADPQSLGTYTYSNNNPLTYSDPTGLLLNAIDDRGPWEVLAPPKKKDKGFLSGFIGKALEAGEGFLSSEAQIFGDAKACVLDFSGNACKNTAVRAMPVLSVVQNGPALIDGIANDVGEIIDDYSEGRPEQATGELAFFLLSNVETSGEGSGLRAAKKVNEGAKSASTAEKLSDLLEKAKCATRGHNSFPAGTVVLLADGTEKPIEDVKPGDEVLATEPETGETAAKEVDATLITPDDREFTTITLDGDGSTLTATDHHPFWAANRGAWVDASNLLAGDTVRTADGTLARVAATTHVLALMPAYNLTVRGIHTYYVLAGTTPVLVHNAGKGGVCGPGDIPNVVHDGVDDIINNGRPPRLTPQGNVDTFTVRPNTPPAIARKWDGATIYDIPGGGNRYRVLINKYGDIGWVDNHDYTKIMPYFPHP
ncbi:polymorphic toxin-type HINT domain-containing protein [Kitasatospora griseola]|uniref:polymorphic toxin-type HINT domain-containing protein n=1 Tax=Kitasatospora griseola TaxID=2064 RepID=UPI003855C5CB